LNEELAQAQLETQRVIRIAHQDRLTNARLYNANMKVIEQLKVELVRVRELYNSACEIGEQRRLEIQKLEAE
jgi:hypothetical protein